MILNKHQFVGKKVRLGDVCSIVSGATPKTAVADYWNGDIKWVTPAELDDNSHVIYDTAKHLTEKGFSSASLHMLPKGTVLLTTRAPIGKVAIAGEEMCCNQGFKNLICSDVINNEYLYRYLKSRSSELQALGRGATFKELSKKSVAAYELNLPPLNYQLEAVEKLTFVDNQITAVKAQLDELDSLVKSRFVEMFESDGRFVTLKECCSSIRGGKTPSMKHPEYYGGDIPFVKSGDVKQDVVSCGVLSLTEKAVSEAGVKLVPKNSILVVTRSAMLHRKMRSALSMRDLAINQDIKAFVPLPEYLPSYLLWAIRSHEQELLSGVRTVSTCALDFDQLCSLKVRRVPLALQQEFASFSSQVDKSRFADLCSTRNHQACSCLSLV